MNDKNNSNSKKNSNSSVYNFDAVYPDGDVKGPTWQELEEMWNTPWTPSPKQDQEPENNQEETHVHGR